jgi:hypothetical protein
MGKAQGNLGFVPGPTAADSRFCRKLHCRGYALYQILVLSVDGNVLQFIPYYVGTALMFLGIFRISWYGL